MQQVSAVFNDRVLSPVDQGVWWVEYVLRHNGAKHLRPVTVDLHWTQYFGMDIVAFIAAAMCIGYKVLQIFARFVRRKLIKTKIKIN